MKASGVSSLVKRVRGLIPTDRCVTISPKGTKKRGTVLYSYINTSLKLRESDPILSGHSNSWESREIARIFVRFGYEVHAISWSDTAFVPKEDYDVVFDISNNLQRLAAILEKRPLLLLHLTGSYARYQNAAEVHQITAMEKRRGSIYTPKRLVPFVELAEKSLRLADHCSLIGTTRTLATYPEEYRTKIRRVTVSATPMPFRKTPREYLPSPKEFLWYFGSGAVHKGLDIVLEAFARHPSWVLNIVGNVGDELDFVRIYRKELYQLGNVHYHGFLSANDDVLREVFMRSFCFVAPSCSESISTAAATCMQVGLYPIVSRDTGIDLPQNCGLYLNELTPSGIEAAVNATLAKTEKQLSTETECCQLHALASYSRERFSEMIQDYVANVLQ